MRGVERLVYFTVAGVGLAGVVGCDYPSLGAVQVDAAIDAPVDAAPPSPVLGPSCQSLAPTCGADGTDSCCNPGLLVPGGTYFRSYDLAGDANSGTQSAPAVVNAFWLDKYEVSVGRFRAFVTAGQGLQSSGPPTGVGEHTGIYGSGWYSSWSANLSADQPTRLAALKCSSTLQTWTDSPGANESRPMNCVTWYEAMAFCIWDGGYLPTEAEWNYAATGGDQQRAYPWSVPAAVIAIDGSRVSYQDGTGCVGDGVPACALTDLVPVGSKGPLGEGRWGHSDLAGNVYEWTLDWNGTYPVPCDNCAQVSLGTSRVIRGGAFNNSATSVRPSLRNNMDPLARVYFAGFRCARPSKSS